MVNAWCTSTKWYLFSPEKVIDTVLGADSLRAVFLFLLLRSNRGQARNLGLRGRGGVRNGILSGIAAEAVGFIQDGLALEIRDVCLGGVRVWQVRGTVMRMHGNAPP